MDDANEEANSQLAFVSFTDEMEINPDEPLMLNEREEDSFPTELNMLSSPTDSSVSRFKQDCKEDNGHAHHWCWMCLHYFTRKFHTHILLFWVIIIWPLGLYSLPRLMKAADSTFQAVPGTIAADALDAYHRAYAQPNHTHSHDPHFKPIIALFQLDNTSSSTSNSNLIDSASLNFQATRDYIQNYTEYLHAQFSEHEISIENFYHLYAQFPVLAKRSMASPDGNLILMNINPPATKLSKTELFTFLEQITSYPKEVASPPKDVTVSYTGVSLFQQDMIISSKNDVTSLDTISLPISLLILCYVLGSSVPLLILPILTILSTIFLWSTVLYAAVLKTNIMIAQFTPSIMMSLTIAMSVDYSLFYLSRTLEELGMSSASTMNQNRQILERANLNALATAGHSILVSGSTLAMCLIGLTILPLNMMVSTGIGSSIAVVSCIIVNMTVLPSILHTQCGQWLIFYQGRTSFSSVSSLLSSFCCCIKKRESILQPLYDMSMFNKFRRKMRIFLYKELPLDNIQIGDNPDFDIGRNTNIDITPLLLEHELGIDYERVAELNCVKSDDISFESGNDLKQVDSHISIYSTRSNRQRATQTRQYEQLQIQSQSESDLPDKSGSSSLWMHLGKFILLHSNRSKAILAILVFCFILPVSYFLFQLKTSIAMELMVPYNSPALVTYQKLGSVFGKGALSPYQIVFDGSKANKTIDSSEGFRFMQQVLRNLTNEDMMVQSHNDDFSEGLSEEDKSNLQNLFKEQKSFSLLQYLETEKNYQEMFEKIENTLEFSSTDQSTVLHRTLNLFSTKSNQTVSPEFATGFPATPTLSSYTGIPTLNGTLIPYYIYEVALMCQEIATSIYHTNCPVPALHALAFISNRTCSYNHHTTSVTAILQVDPFTAAGVNWLTSAREVLENITSQAKIETGERPFDVYIIGGAANEYDAIAAIFQSFPKMIGLTTLIVFVFMGISFRSIGVPVRSVLSIGATLSFVYGLAVLVYQYGAFDWTHLRCVERVGAISFLPPIMAFTVIVGLGLDYDVFLTTRILEYRSLGYTHTSSILLGLEKTGRIITAAGIIMCVAFGGLLFSDTLVLNQFSFFLVSAVMLDTFVIRTILVPIVLELCGDRWGWWPRKFPHSFKSVL